MMDFEGKQKVGERVRQGQTSQKRLAALEQICRQLAQRLSSVTGEDLSGLLGALGGAPAGSGGSRPAGSVPVNNTAYQSYRRAAQLAQGAGQARFERGSPF